MESREAVAVQMARWVLLLHIKQLFAIGCLFALGTLSFAERRALLVGVEQYQQSDEIATLSAATSDARSLKETLVQAAGFAPHEVSVLTTDEDDKPRKRTILAKLAQMAGDCSSTRATAFRSGPILTSFLGTPTSPAKQRSGLVPSLRPRCFACWIACHAR
jgi:hypothetical protein